MIRFTRFRYHALTFSLTVTVLAIFGLFTKKLNLSIDFTGGIYAEFKTSSAEKVVVDAVNAAFNSDIRNNVKIQRASVASDQRTHYSIYISNDALSMSSDSSTTKIKASLYSVTSGDIDFIRIDHIGPKIGNLSVAQAVKATIYAFLVMMLYILIRFNWQFAVSAVIGLAHTFVMTLGLFVVTQYEFDLNSIAALLTIIGYSINDSIVLYDRIRENIRGMSFANAKMICDIIDTSISDVLSRTIITNTTTLIACLMLVIFGGEALKSFSVSVFFGITFGIYSSIYISATFITIFYGFGKGSALKMK